MTRSVLLVTPDFPPDVGGIQHLLERLVGHARRVRFEVVTLASPGAAEWDRAQAFAVRRVPAAWKRQGSIARLNLAALDHARRTRPDVVLAGHIVTAPAAIAIARTLGIPYAVYLYALEVRERARLAGMATRHAAAVIAISRYTASLAREVGAPQERLHVIPPGVDLLPSPKGPRGGEPPRVLTVARLQDRYKGHDVMVRALPLIRARVPQAEWVVIGDGRLRAEIERLAAANGASPAVRLCGSVPDAERDGWYERSHVFAMPSRLPPGSAGEGFGIVYLEAAVRGVPSVAGNVGGALDAIRDGETGLLVDPSSHVAVADAVAGLLEDPERCARLGEAATRHASAFAWPRIAERVEEVLLDVAAGRR